MGQSNYEKFTRDLIVKNNIKTITEWSHPYQGGSHSAKGNKSSFARFDRNGNLLEEINYNARGDETRKATHRYNNSGNRIEYTVYESRFSKITYSQYANYDKSGNRLSEWGFDGLGNYRNNYILDPTGNILEIHFTVQNNLTEKRIFKYSKLQTEISIFAKGTNLSGKIVLKYNEGKKLIEESETDASGNILKKVTYSYNLANQLIKETRFHGIVFSYANNHQYNPVGQLTEIEREELSSKPTVTHKYSYDSSGRLSEEQWYSENAKDYSTKKYQYDNKGNILSLDCFFISYKFRVLYKYSIEYH